LMLAKGGTLVLLASAQHGTKFEVDLSKMHYDQSIITGSVSYTAPGYQWAIQLLSDHRLDVDTLITHTGPLESTSEFLNMTKMMEGLKKVVLL
jgi:threonine dehydrogenase-like Zn-dependent dehydrogenase